MFERRTLAALVTYPPSWFAVAVCAGALWGFFIWFTPGAGLAATAVGVTLAVLLAWPLLALRDRAFLARLVRPAGEHDTAAAERLRTLDAALQRLNAEQGLEQLRLLRQKLTQLTEVLRHRLDEGEVTYGRYLASAEQVYLAALDNLQEMVIALTSLSGMDADYLDRRVAEIERDGVTDKERAELETIAQRRALMLQQRDKIEHLLGENERALTVLDNTSVALADTRTRGGQARVTADEAIRELEALAGRTSRYASGK